MIAPARGAGTRQLEPSREEWNGCFGQRLEGRTGAGACVKRTVKWDKLAVQEEEGDGG